MKKNIHSGHRDRLRSRFIRTGIDSFTEHEILELLIFYAIPRINTNELAHRLIDKFGSLSEVLDAAPSQLCDVDGIGESAACFLGFARDFCRYYALSDRSEISFSSPRDTEAYLLSYFGSSDSDICLILSVDSSFNLKSSVVFPTEELLSPDFSRRILAEAAIRRDIYRIIIGQNKPRSLPVPQTSDYAITRLFSETLSPLGIEIYDHILCGMGKAFSMRQNGAFSFSREVQP